MKYREIISFEPIESVVQLRQADEVEKARDLVRSYVISDRMAEQISDIIVPHMQFERPADQKGLLILGNYGTGKSHLMSLLSAVAERAELVESVDHPQVQEAMQQIAGKFKVRRIELGAVSGSLRDKLLTSLEQAFTEWETPYAFPPATAITNNKDPLIAAMGAFHQEYPNQGVLLVVDELLDFLRGQNEQELVRDLAFLREIGEVAALTNFRFMTGLQEMLFDNPRFAFVAEPLNRVRDRFEQVSIVREDIAFVVSNRLLKKSDEQKARIQEHLQPFTPLYSNMSERLDEHIRLFPIHPAYLDTFQNVRIAEKREVLKTFSAAIRSLLDEDLPEDEPGEISFDHYYDILQANKSLRTLPDFAEVMDKSSVLAARVDTAYSRPALKPMADRIVRGLAVHRFTTEEITDPIGASPIELRDTLGLYVKTPEVSADFLGDQVRVALNEIMKTVNGQYISHNDVNDQYYLDVKKDIDFDAHLKAKAEALSPDEVNRAYFDSLAQILEFESARSYVSHYRIWLDEVPWESRRSNRPGYVFFGEPTERSTAQPERDYFVYVMPQFTGSRTIPETQEDEVVFSLTAIDAAFENMVRAYAAATMMANESSSHRQVYRGMADERLRKLRGWLEENLLAHLQVTYQGVTIPAAKALGGARSTSTTSLAEVIKRIAGAQLAPYFEERYPDYPAFTELASPVTEANRAPTASEALRMIATGNPTRQAKAVLAGLELLDDDGRIRPGASRYAQGVLEFLTNKPNGQVVNRNELIEAIAVGIQQPIEKDRRFRLEPEWIAVLLAALAYSGDIVITLDKSETIDASTIDKLVMTSIDRIAHFQHFGRPKDVPIENWKTIFEGFGLAPGLIVDPSNREQAIKELQAKVQSDQNGVTQTLNRLTPKLTLWSTPVFSDNFHIEAVKGSVVGDDLPDSPLLTSKLSADLRGYKSYLDELSKFNTPGKMQNLRLTSGEISAAQKQARTLRRAQELLQLVDSLQSATSYLAQAAEILTRTDPWQEEAGAIKNELLLAIRKYGNGESTREDMQRFNASLADLRKTYVDRYTEAHQMAVLGPSDDDQRKRLREDPRLQQMRELSKLELLAKNRTELEGWNKALINLPVCIEFHPGLLETKPKCTCGFAPAQRQASATATSVLNGLDERLDQLQQSWRQAVTAGLQSDIATQSLDNMTLDERKPVEAFLGQKDGDPTTPAGFVAAASNALQGISAVAIDPEDLLSALRAGGMPCTVEQLQQRFSAYVTETMRNKDSKSTRIAIAAEERE